MTFLIDRRQTLAVLAGAGLAGTSVLTAAPRDARADIKTLEDAARREGSLTWYVAQVDAEKAEAMGRRFTSEHPGITVSVIRTTGQVAYQRLSLDIKNHTPQCDVFSTTDISHMPVLQEKHELASYTPENAAGLLPEFARLSEKGVFYITNASRYFLIYNTQRVKPEDVPKKWTDMLDPKWKGRVATGHPAFSGCTGIWALSLKKKYGWEFFEKLAANNPRIGRSAVDPGTLITAGECLVGVGSANNTYSNIDKGNPLGASHPTDGLVLCNAPSAIPAKAPHPNAAKLFLEWLLSDTFSRMIAADGSEPLRIGVPPRPDEPPLSGQTVIPLTVEEIRKGVPEVIEQWRETFGS